MTCRSHDVDSDFTLDNAPGLAFAARATSSFPGAFPPAHLAEVEDVAAERADSWPRRSEFLARNFQRHLIRHALDTARLACEALGLEVSIDERLKGGPFDPEELVGDAEALLVGHDPDFSAAVHAATGAQVRMKKGGLAGIDRGELKVLMRPNESFALAE